MMCLRDSPTSLGPFGPVGQYTLVKISSDCPALALQRLAQHRLGRGVRVGVGGVEGRDPGIQGGPHARVAVSFSTCEPWVSQLP